MAAIKTASSLSYCSNGFSVLAFDRWTKIPDENYL
jgi:hypothetical protein